MSKPGTLITDYYIICAVCEYGEHVGETERHKAVRAAQEQGWHCVDNRGWCCPGCFGDLAEQASAAGKEE